MKEFFFIIRRNFSYIFACITLTFIIILATVGYVCKKIDLIHPNRVSLTEKLQAPSFRHIMGTDHLGRDIFFRMIDGACTSLLVGIVAVGISIIIGIIIGAISGYFGNCRVRLYMILILGFLIVGIWYIKIYFLLGIVSFFCCFLFYKYRGTKLLRLQIMSVDTLFMGFTEVMMCFPSFFLLLTIAAMVEPGFWNIMIIIGLTSWMSVARFVRAEFLSLRERDFVLGAKAIGLPDWKIILFYLLPNALSPLLVYITIGMAGAILIESGLSFLGFGVQPPHATWGNILSDGKLYLFDAWWMTFFPGMAILLTVLSLNLLGEAIKEFIDPRLKEKSL